MDTKDSKTKWTRTRQVFNQIHLWLGISSGIILFVVCLTGTIYAFNVEIQELLRRQKYFVDVPDDAMRLPVEEAAALVKNKVGNGQVQHIVVPADKDRVYRVNFKKEAPLEDAKGNPFKKPDTGIYSDRGMNFLVNPYTGGILGANEGRLFYFFRTVYKIHRWLLLETNIGRPIVGAATIIFVVLVLSGLVIWVPEKVRKWRQGFKVKLNANWKRINHSFHIAFGFYASFLLLVMALTGLTWSFEWYKDGFFKVLGVERPALKAAGEPLQSMAPIDGQGTNLKVHDFLKAADEILPYRGDYRVVLPANALSAVSIHKTRTGFFAVSGVDKILLDQYSAVPLEIDLFENKPLNEKITSSIKAIHIGEIFSTFSKILYFMACLMATSLPVTGTIVWINKLTKSSKKADKRKKLGLEESNDAVKASLQTQEDKVF
jgi:uncharacterized iron-regulated membrane protein